MVTIWREVSNWISQYLRNHRNPFLCNLCICRADSPISLSPWGLTALWLALYEPFHWMHFPQLYPFSCNIARNCSSLYKFCHPLFLPVPVIITDMYIGDFMFLQYLYSIIQISRYIEFIFTSYFGVLKMYIPRLFSELFQTTLVHLYLSPFLSLE